MSRFKRGMPNRRRIAIALVVVFVFALALTPGCEGIPSSEQLTLFGYKPITLDPALCGDAASASYIVEIFSGLVTLNEDLEVIEDIAQGWDISPDGKTYTFHLREGVRFHDGKEVTAGDFKYSLERAADPATYSPVAEAYLGDIVGVKEKLRGEADEVSGVRVIDDETLEITIDAPKAYFLAKLTHSTAFVVDEQNVESGWNWTEHPNGSGPFKLREWREGERIVLERNEHFYRGVAKLERVTFHLIGNPMMMYENGEIDITSVSAANIERVLDPTNPLNEELVITPQLSIGYVGFNIAMPPFDDVKVRQGLCHAVDKEKIVEILLKNLVSPAYGILPPGMPGYDEELEGLAYNLERARELVSVAWWLQWGAWFPIMGGWQHATTGELVIIPGHMQGSISWLGYYAFNQMHPNAQFLHVKVGQVVGKVPASKWIENLPWLIGTEPSGTGTETPETRYAGDLPPIVFSVVGSGAYVSPVAIVIAWMWQENLGVEVEIEGVEWETFLEDLREGKFQAFMLGWIADYPDPENFLDLLFHSESVENHTAYSNPYVDQLLEAAREESDFDTRMGMYQEVEQIIVGQAPWLPLWFDRDYLLVKPYVKGFLPAPMGIPYLKDIWIER